MLKILTQCSIKIMPIIMPIMPTIPSLGAAFTLGLTVIIPSINNINIPSALAQSNIQCKENGTMAEMKKCADEKYMTADEQLNQAYEQLMVRVKDQVTAKEYLTQAQRAWITFRDKSCSFESVPYAGGSIESLVYTKCLTRMTETRTKELTNYINNWGKEPDGPITNPPANNTPVNPISIESLPDGNYRFATAKLSQSIISDQDLVKAGGYYFLFRKQGRNIVGTFAQVDSENSICISGRVNGNTVAGRAVELVELPQRDPSVKSIDDQFVFWDLGGDILAVRRGEKKNGKVIYNGALLNLGYLFRYNAGMRPPVSQCPF